jgi:uncharacterized membrane protein
MVRTLLNIQLLFYGMTYLMILEKLPILTNLYTKVKKVNQAHLIKPKKNRNKIKLVL